MSPSASNEDVPRRSTHHLTHHRARRRPPRLPALALPALALLASGLLTSGLLTAPAAAAAGSTTTPGQPPVLSGTVTAEDTGGPVEGVTVTAFTTDDEYVDETVTTATGRWVLPGLETGTGYVLRLDPPEAYVGQWAQDAAYRGDATVYHAPATVDVSLVSTVRVQGTVRDQDGSPAAEVWVDLLPTTDATLGRSAPSDEEGRWSVLVAPGTYVAAFQAEDGTAWYADAALDRDSARVLDVRPGTPLTLDTRVPPPTRVTGRVTATASGEPVAGVCATLADPEDLSDQQGLSCTDQYGRYGLTAAAGTWVVVVTDDTGTHAPGVSEPVTVRPGNTVADVDLALAPGGRLTGRVVDRASGEPVEGVCPAAHAGTEGPYVLGQVISCTDADGRWTLSGLPAQPTTVLVGRDDVHAARWVGGLDTQASATPHAVVPGESVTVATTRLHRGATLTGRVTDTGGSPVQGAWVELGDAPSRSGPGEGEYSAETDADGRYTIGNVPRGSRVAVVYGVPGAPHAWQWSGGVGDPAQATPLSLSYGRTTTFDAVLRPGATLEVTVSGAPAEWVVLDALTPSGTPVGWSADVRDDGTASITGLPAGQVRVRARARDEARTTTWFDGAGSAQEATPVTVEGGRTTRIAVHFPPP